MGTDDIIILSNAQKGKTVIFQSRKLKNKKYFEQKEGSNFEEIEQQDLDIEKHTDLKITDVIQKVEGSNCSNDIKCFADNQSSQQSPQKV